MPFLDNGRKASGQSFATTTTIVDERTHFHVDGPYGSDESIDRHTTHSLPDSLAVSTISPYYEWLEQSDTVIRNIPRTKIKLNR